jgi:hypothetical protein
MAFLRENRTCGREPSVFIEREGCRAEGLRWRGSQAVGGGWLRIEGG